ncbi:hypothetical protein HZC53_02835 [Candidatus Uhrbacteria bacterium]|nr:hypothetical protein [Candidatus Uhrbacteria bacterium]
MPKHKRPHSSLSATLALIGLGTFILVVLVAKPYQASADVPPTVDSVAVTDQSYNDILSLGLHPIEAGTLNVTVHGQVSDGDGCSNIDYVDVYMYRSSVWPMTGANCALDENNCYGTTLLAQELTNCGRGATADYSVTFETKNFIDPTDVGTYASDTWIVRVKVMDSQYNNVTHDSSVFEVQSLAAFTVTPVLDFGTVGLGGYSQYQTVTFTNTGNTNLNTNVRVDGPLISDREGFSIIPLDNVRYGLNYGFEFSTGAAISTSDTLLSIQLPQQVTANGGIPPTEEAFFQLLMPATGVRGNYHNTLTFTAVGY